MVTDDMIKTRGAEYRLICSMCGAIGKPIRDKKSNTEPYAVQCQNPKCGNCWDGAIECIERNTFGVFRHDK